jgi:glycosyltransferase involved in cell wall biosynthesis
MFVMTIGHKLTKYVQDKNKPVLVTTNHLLDEKYFIKLDKKILSGETFKILFVGDVQVRKGLMYLFKAFKMLVDDGLNVQLEIVGSGASEMTLKEYTANQKLDEKVTFHGRVPHGPLLFEYFKNANIFVLPSVGAEGVPRVTHEAMAMSCPVIATDVGSVAWQLKDNSGIIVPLGDETSIYHAIKKLINDSAEYQKLVNNGYQRSLEFTYEKQKKSIQDFITRMLND